MAARRPARGFTLIELVVVLTILGVIVLLVFPRMGGTFSSAYLRSSARRLAGMIRYAQNQAGTTGRNYRLYYNLDGAEYWLAEEEEGEFRESGTDLGRRRRLLPGILFEDIITPREGKQTTEIVYTQFSPRGGVERTDIHLRSEKGEELSLLVRGLAGEVEIYDGYEE